MHGSYFIHGSDMDIQDAYQYKLSTVITYKCDTGYRLIGPSSIECVQGSQWSHHAPQCVTSQGRNISYDYVMHQSVLGFSMHLIPIIVNSALLYTTTLYDLMLHNFVLREKKNHSLSYKITTNSLS